MVLARLLICGSTMITRLKSLAVVVTPTWLLPPLLLMWVWKVLSKVTPACWALPLSGEVLSRSCVTKALNSITTYSASASLSLFTNVPNRKRESVPSL